MRDKYDVIIIGGGISGLYAAINIDSRARVLVAAKRELLLCNSSLAQGGVAGVLDTVNDSYQLHINDTLIAGQHKNRLSAVETLVNEGPSDLNKIINMGVDFDRDKDGNLHQTLEGGHCRNRIIHHRDSTGEAIMKTLVSVVKNKPNIDIVENLHLCDLQECENGMAAVFISKDDLVSVSASFIILATGGIGRVYKYTTNSSIATGDGIAISSKLGAKIENLHYIQFHPTAFASAEGRERFLISEAVRGEGAYLLNYDGKRFMDRYDERLELAPRDVVSHAIMLESRRTGSERFYLDITHRNKSFVKDRFPMIYERCLHEGIDITSEVIPVFPCQHYLMGGIDVDLNSKTRLDRLYAVGECSHTGVHGKNRLASNSLLEALVFGRRAAEHINLRNDALSFNPPNITLKSGTAPMPSGMRTEIREIMQRAHFVIPDADAASKGLQKIRYINKRLNTGGYRITRDFVEATSLARIAEIILESAAEA